MGEWHEHEAKAECLDLRVRVRELEANNAALRAEVERLKQRSLMFDDVVEFHQAMDDKTTQALLALEPLQVLDDDAVFRGCDVAAPAAMAETVIRELLSDRDALRAEIKSMEGLTEYQIGQLDGRIEAAKDVERLHNRHEKMGHLGSIEEALDFAEKAAQGEVGDDRRDVEVERLAADNAALRAEVERLKGPQAIHITRDAVEQEIAKRVRALSRRGAD